MGLKEMKGQDSKVHESSRLKFCMGMVCAVQQVFLDAAQLKITTSFLKWTKQMHPWEKRDV